MIGYSPEAERWFDSLSRHREAFPQDDHEDIGISWMELRVDGGDGRTFTLPIRHGVGRATEFSLQYVCELPRLWERLGVQSMTILQGLELKSRALIMGDIANAMRVLLGEGALPGEWTGRIAIRNPYHCMTHRMIVALEKADPSVPVVSGYAPMKWRSFECIDRYEVKTLHKKQADGVAIGIGLAVADDITDVSPFDLSGSLALREAS